MTMRNYFSIILFCFFELIFSNHNFYAQCTNTCSSNLIQNPGFETPSSLCGTTTDIQLYNTQSPVSNWFGTDNFPNAGSSPDYFSPCAGSTNSANLPCLNGTGRVGIFTKTSFALGREYVQSQLVSPLVAGKTYCYSMVVKSRVGAAGNILSSCDGIGAWFHNQGLINIQTMNGGNQFIGPSSTINASPQVQNPSGNLIGAACVTVTGTFCAQGGESWIVIGNFRDDANTTITGSNPSNYMYIEDNQLFELCSSTPSLIVTASPLVVSCGQSSTLTVTSTFPSGTSYSWVSPFGNTLSGIGNQVVTPSSNTTYSLVATYTNNCGVQTQTASVSITASGGTPVTPTFTPIGSVCNGANPPILPSSSNNTPTITGTWNPPVINNTTSGTYTFSPNAGQCATTQTLAITIIPSPTLSVNSPTICAGGSATLTASGASIYSWSAGLSSTTGSVVTTTPLSTSIYTLTGAVGSCASSVTSTVTIYSPTITVSSANICLGAIATLTASGASTYTWLPGNISGNTLTVSPSSNTIYTVNGSSNSCLGTSTASVNVNSIPIVSVNSPTICSGASTTLSAVGATSYTWSNGVTTNTTTVSATTNPTNYTVTGAVNGCTNSAVSSVSVMPNPTISLNSPTICTSGTATLVANGALSYTWTAGLSASTGSIVTGSPLSTTIYTVIGSSNNCTNTATSTISITPPVIITSSSVAICNGNSATLTANGANTYTWLPTNTAGSSINVTPTSNTSYTVNGTVGACTGSTTVNVSVIPIPTVTVNNATICEGQPAILNAQGASSYTWSNGSNNNSVSINPISTSVYTVIGAVNGCTNTSTSNVLVNPSPLLTTSSDITIIKGTSTTLNFAGNVTSYTWTPTTALSCTNCMSPVATPSQTTQYCINATLGDCSSSSCILVTVEPACFSNADYGTPNAFTPNGDGINDEFCLKGWDECSTDFYISIYNRWGEKVYESTDPAFCWDGSYLGNPLNSAVFVFYIKAEILKVGTITKKGNISLIK